MDNQFLPIEPKKDTAITNKRQIERGAVSKAIYMVTDLFEEKEPLRLALRDVSVDILRSNSIEHTSKLKSLLILSKEVGLISQINAEILLRAINSIEEDTIYNRVDKNIDISSVLKVDTSEAGKGENHTNLDNIDESPESPKEASEQPQKVEKKPEAEVTPQKVERPTQSSPTVTTLDIGTRRKKILEVVRSKGQATIHEFIESIQGCSSKTIQRELTSLVLSGTLKKTGERRWSKYSLR